MYKRPEMAATCPTKPWQPKIHLFFHLLCQEEINQCLSLLIKKQRLDNKFG